MKNLILSLLALTILCTACRDPEPLEESTVDLAEAAELLEGVWTGIWVDDPQTEIELEIWLDTNNEINLEAIAPDDIKHTLVMSSNNQFTIPEYESNGLKKRYEGELIADVLHIDYFWESTVAPFDSGSSKVQLTKT